MNEIIESGDKILMSKVVSDVLIKLAKKYKNLIVLHADFIVKLGLKNFASAFPDRIFNFGLGEENMVGAAVGFAVRGKIPVVVGYANFVGKAWEQIRSSVCYPNLNIKFLAVNAGISAGEDGVGYQVTEDIALMRAIPNMKIVSPADYYEAASAIEKSVDEFGPVYVRLASGEMPVVLDEKYEFEFGKAISLSEGKDVCVFTHGASAWNVLKAAEILSEQGVGVQVIDVASIKPIDKKMIMKSVMGMKLCVVVEDNNFTGGLFGAIAEVLAESAPIVLKRISLDDRFAESGSADELFRKYSLDSSGIVHKIREFLC